MEWESVKMMTESLTLEDMLISDAVVDVLMVWNWHRSIVRL